MDHIIFQKNKQNKNKIMRANHSGELKERMINNKDTVCAR